MIYVEDPKAIKELGKNWQVNAGQELLEKLEGRFGKENVRVV